MSLCSCITNLVNTTDTLLQFWTSFLANKRYLFKIKTLLKVLTIYSKTNSLQDYHDLVKTAKLLFNIFFLYY